MIAVLDIFQLAPDFQSAVMNVHNVLMPVALVVCFGGLTFIAVQAQRERSLGEIWPAMLRIFLVSIGLVFLPTIGNWLEQLVLDVEQASGVGNGSAFSDYLGAIKQKFGVDLSALNSLVPIGPNGAASNGAGSSGPTVSTYGYEKPGDPTYDANSAQGIGAFSFDSAPGSLVPGRSLALSPDLAAGLTPGQQVTVQLANGQSITGIYADKTAASFNGQTLHRVDIYDPNQQYGNLSGVGVTSINGGALPAQGGNPIGDFFNGLTHPAETVAIGIFGMAVLFLSYVAVFIWWMVALLQSILFYSEIAIAPIFVGFLLVRGFDGIAKGFILSFFAICLWPIAFLVTGLVTRFIISMAVNSGNSSALTSANAAGLTYFWLVGLAIWVVVGSAAGPWIISRRMVSGASGLTDMMLGSRAAAGRVYHAGSQAVSGVTGGPISIASMTRMSGATTSFARRPPPVNGRN